MSQIKTEHRGYPITYSENEDVWNCYDLGSGKAASAPTLTEIKAKIDAFLLAERKAGAVDCYELRYDRDYKVQAVPSRVIEYLGPKIDTPYTSSQGRVRRVVGHKFAVVAKRPGRERAARTATETDYLARATPEVEAAIAEADRLGRIAARAVSEFMLAYKAIPRVQPSDTPALVALSGIDPTGGLTQGETE